MRFYTFIAFLLSPLFILNAAHQYSANFIYTSPATLPLSTDINVYLAVYNLAGQATLTQFYVEALTGPSQVEAFDLVLQTNDVVYAIISTSNSTFSSLSPDDVGTLAVQINGQCSFPVTLQTNDPSSVVGFVDQRTIYQAALLLIGK